VAFEFDYLDSAEGFYLTEKGAKKLELESMYLSLPFMGSRLRDFVVSKDINPNCTDIYKNNALMSALKQCLLGLNKLETIKTLLSMGTSSMTENMFGFSPIAFSAICPSYIGEVFSGEEEHEDCNHFIKVSVQDKISLAKKIEKKNCYKPKVLRFPYEPESLRVDIDVLDHICSGKDVPLFLIKQSVNSSVKSVFSQAFCLFKEQYLRYYSEKQLKRYIDYYLDQKINYVILGIT